MIALQRLNYGRWCGLASVWPLVRFGLCLLSPGKKFHFDAPWRVLASAAGLSNA
jgi:hypothetical protein